MNKFKITPLFIFLAIIEIVLILLTLYFFLIENKNGMLLGGVITLIAAFFNALIIAFQQAIANVKGISKKVLWTTEIVIIVALIIYVAINGISIG